MKILETFAHVALLHVNVCGLVIGEGLAFFVSGFSMNLAGLSEQRKREVEVAEKNIHAAHAVECEGFAATVVCLPRKREGRRIEFHSLSVTALAFIDAGSVFQSHRLSFE